MTNAPPFNRRFAEFSAKDLSLSSRGAPFVIFELAATRRSTHKRFQATATSSLFASHLFSTQRRGEANRSERKYSTLIVRPVGGSEDEQRTGSLHEISELATR